MFGDVTIAESVGDERGANLNKTAGSIRRRSVVDQLTEFRSFWASLAVSGMDNNDQVECCRDREGTGKLSASAFSTVNYPFS